MGEYVAGYLVLTTLHRTFSLNFRAEHRGRGFDTEGTSFPLSSVRRSGAPNTVIDFSTGKDSQVRLSLTPAYSLPGFPLYPRCHADAE